ncbi:MAG: tyrosine-type recombinase/integrase [Hyphomonadaceae bacterium]|nr:tyrosine-type recombinase/integrase [Hyphomonadaceae bacterium]
MATLSDGTIRSAIKRVQFTGRSEILRDGEGRGVGRLLLVLRPRQKRLTTYWSAAQYREGRKVQIKIGDYPSMGLAEAREVFQRDYANLIQKGRHIRVARDTRTGTVGDLFDGYAEYLRTSGKSSWKEARKGLTKIADTLGRDRLARDIEPDEITDILRPIYLRGTRSMADHVRSYVRSAYSWAMKSEHDYRTTSPRRFGIARNPAAGIPTEPKVVGTRWLRDEEFVQLYRWLENPSSAIHPPYARAVRILMLTGQRVEEIASLHKDQYDRAEKLLDWSTTKNRKPHTIPLPSLAIELLEEIQPNEHGWFFPSAMDPSRPVTHGTLYAFMWRTRETGVIPYVTNRDLRRTWKTLAGQAGISKELRDRIQNHTLQDVSSKSYDRWSYMPEKRNAMDVWDRFVRGLLDLTPGGGSNVVSLRAVN